MPILRNTGPKTPIGIPGGQVIPPGGKAIVSPDAWGRMQSNPIVKAWRKAGILVAEGEVPAPVETSGSPSPPPVGHAEIAPDDPAELAAEKDLVIAELAQYGIEKDRRSSLPTLWGLLDEAKKAHGVA